MRRGRLLGIASVMVILTLGAVAWSAPPETPRLDEWNEYLEGHSYGPYQGRVVDTETKEPIQGAVVVAVWRRDKIYPLHSTRVIHAVRETLTDRDGRWRIEARQLEERSPRRALRPSFVIFFPGYGSFPKAHVAPGGFIGGIFEGKGTTVELRRLTTREERIVHQRWLDPWSLSDAPWREIPEFMRLLSVEDQQLGLEPLLPRERK
jgi:hypothetical protein